ncbi:hypothetical protein LCGC14_2709960 [marine sediment metagenome]|uniref:Uncharacterized protein n=1 Tax=marine sediment metagenome TaxID=412755 RepID=A0A0F9C4X7_9ZZZZ
MHETSYYKVNGDPLAKIVKAYDELGLQVVIFAQTQIVSQTVYDGLPYHDKQRYNADDPTGYADDKTLVYFVTPDSGFYEVYYGMFAASCENCRYEFGTGII